MLSKLIIKLNSYERRLLSNIAVNEPFTFNSESVRRVEICGRVKGNITDSASVHLVTERGRFFEVSGNRLEDTPKLVNVSFAEVVVGTFFLHKECVFIKITGDRAFHISARCIRSISDETKVEYIPEVSITKQPLRETY